LLDKFVKSYNPLGQETQKWQEAVQKRTIQEVVRLSRQSPPGFDFSALARRWTAALHTLQAISFRVTTTGPLTLHLARASALENAGICLHPLYGFAYLPGSGLKGMARAYAETVWLPAQTDQKQAWRRIEDVFGWAPHPDRRQQISDPHHPAEVRRKDDHDPESPEIKASTGSIIFHDAWPESWPQLIVDIVNNHHPAYYQHDDNDHPPGDWENPVPVYFLAVKSGTTFTFALAKRRDNVPDELLTLAQQWLLGAPCHLGAGAKTATGYGAFKPAEGERPPLPTQQRATFETTLELVTPAFLAGANQQADDCDLRPATLRGLLRWWWRTMHAGFVDVKTLRALEAAIWGDTKSGGAVRIVLETDESHGITLHRKVLYSHPQNRGSGTRYVAYGMDETSKRQRRQRYRLEPPASWKLRLIARPVTWNGKKILGEHTLEQAKAALWLLCQFGGVGSKGRKGFGSLAAKELGIADLDACRKVGSKLREDLSLNIPFAVDRTESPSISDPDLQYIEVDAPSTSAEEVIERIGLTCFAIASRFKHNVDQDTVVNSPNKAAWGLPRKIHGPRDHGPLPRKDSTYKQKPEDWQRPEWLDFPKRPRNVKPENARHASPIHIHVGKNLEGKFVVRILAMPAKYLTNREESIRMLRVFVESFRDKFAEMAHAKTSQVTQSVSIAPTKRSSGTPVRVQILAERPRGGYDVREEGHPQGTLTVGTPPDPPPNVGDTVDVLIHNDDPKCPQYRWPNRAQSVSKSRGGPRGQRPHGRR
jgi:CRISPR-associated protein Cmr6